MSKPAPSVRELIREQYSALTQSERKFANSLLENYPAAGLASITIVAANADVSTPTVARMVQKLGFKVVSETPLEHSNAGDHTQLTMVKALS